MGKILREVLGMIGFEKSDMKSIFDDELDILLKASGLLLGIKKAPVSRGFFFSYSIK
jgi:hypothetical protein